MSRAVRCYDCDRTFEFPRARCACGEPLWFDTDPTSAAIGDDAGSMWRYADLLPVDRPEGIAATAGGTGRFRARSLDGFAGCRVAVKDETTNPTGSFKDRGSAVGVAWAREAGYDRVGTVSHGNMARSTAAMAAGAGLECVVLVPADIPTERLAVIARYGPRIVRVRGDYGRLYHDALALGSDRRIAFVNSDTPLRVAGQKTTGHEIIDEGAPDAVVLPVSSGGHASGIWKAFRERVAAGDIETPPRLYLVQASACAPIAEAYRAGRRVVERVQPGETVAYSIANADPPSGTRALRAARATGGGVCAVADDAIREATAAFATAGMCVEPSSGVALAGLRHLTRSGEIGAGERAVVIATGTGLTERADAAVDAPTVDRGELDRVLDEGEG